MRGPVSVAIALGALGPSPGLAQSEQPATSVRTAEQFLETARQAYAWEPETEPEPCPEASEDEIVVCRQRDAVPDQRLPSPTERAYAAGERPRDPIPDAPYVLGLPECKVEVVCHRMGSAPPPIYIIDLSKIPEALTPEEAALVFRAEDAPDALANPAEASPGAVP